MGIKGLIQPKLHCANLKNIEEEIMIRKIAAIEDNYEQGLKA